MVTAAQNTPTIENDDPDGRAALQALDEMSDEELAVEALEGHPRAFTKLADRYRDRLLRFVGRKIGDSQRAQDLVQETFLRVYRHLHRFDPSRKFSTWIYTIAGNLAKNELRNRSRNPMVLFRTLNKNRSEDEDRPLQWEDTSYAPDDMARKRNLREAVEDAVDELPPHHRKVFVLREQEGKSYQEIANITGLKLGTVKSRLNRARKKFADIVAGRLDEAGRPREEKEAA